MVRLFHVVVAVGACASLAHGQLDRGDCRVAGSSLQFCDPSGVACTASDGKSGTCVQRRNGCECAPDNLCHFQQSTHTYIPIRVSGKSFTMHLAHGDCLIDDGVNCTIDRCDPSLNCVHTADDSRCDDGVFCTTDHCDLATGICGYIDTCPAAIDPDNCLVYGRCDENNQECPADPLVPCCGNGAVEAGEQCDDGNTTPGDGCDAACRIEGNNATLTEDEVQADVTLPNFKLANSFDPDGDDLDILSLDFGTVRATIGGLNVSADFSLVIVGNVVTLAHLGSSVATFTVDFETGTEVIVSLDDAFWNSLGDGDVVNVRVDYTVTDGVSIDSSTETVTIRGVNDAPIDANEAFAFGEDDAVAGPLLLGNKLSNALDPDGDLLIMLSIDAVTYDTSGVTGVLPNLAVTLVDGSFNDGDGAEIAISTDAGTATLKLDLNGAETITDPSSIFSPLQALDALSITVNYTITDGNSTDSSKQTITVHGANDAPTVEGP